MTKLLLAIGMMVGGVVGAATPLEISLVSGVKSVTPGQPFYLALSLKHGPGYHTYWKYPGIVGVPTNIKWKNLPRGIKVGEIEWPEPERTHMFQIRAQGYERDVVLPLRVTPSASLKEGTSVTLRGTASWMACARECNPGFQDLEITLPVRSTAAPEVNPEWQGKIERELARGVQETPAWASEARVSDAEVTITVRPQANARLIKQSEASKLIYFTEDGAIDSDKDQKFVVNADGSFSIHLLRAEVVLGGLKQTLRGVLVRDGGWLTDGSIRAMRLNSQRVRG